MIRLSVASCIVFLLFIRGICYGSETDIEDVYRDEGGHLTLPCKEHDGSGTSQVIWRMSNQHRNNTVVTTDDSLVLSMLASNDSGFYTCTQEDGKVFNRFKVHVRTPPLKLVNVTVVPSTIFALIHWEVKDDGGYPIDFFTAQYRLKHTLPDELPDPWHGIPTVGRIRPTATQIDMYQLKPNSTYIFQVWATNRLGRGEIAEVEAQTKHDVQEIELAKHLLEGAETFDTRTWVAAVAIVMGTLIVLATATIYALCKECRLSLTSVSEKDVETLELIPNIILNPGYQDYAQSEWSEPDENSNDTTTIRLNNNTVVHPIRI